MMRLVAAGNTETDNSCSTQKKRKAELAFSEVAQHAQFQHVEQRLNRDAECLEKAQEAISLDDENESVEAGNSKMPEDASVPFVDELKLAEGYKLFGSLFSQIELQLATEVQLSEKPIEQKFEVASDLLQFRMPIGSESVLKTSNFLSDASVVIDFSNATARSAISLKGRTAAGNRHPAGRSKQDEGQDATIVSQTSVKLTRLLQSKNAEVASSKEVKTKAIKFDDELLLNADKNIQMPEVWTTSGAQPQSSSSLRIEQIVRAVVDQSQKLAAQHVMATNVSVQDNNNGQTLRLSLHPAELGNVDITISKRGKRLEVTIAPHIQATCSLLRGDAQQLLISLGIASTDSDRVLVRIKTADGLMEAHESGGMSRSHSGQNDRSTSAREHSGQAQFVETKQHSEGISNGRSEAEVRSPGIRKLEPGSQYI